MILLFLIYQIVIFYWRIRCLKKESRSGLQSIILFAAYSIAPFILYVVVFFALVTIEDVTTGIALIGESYGRSIIFVAGGGIILSIITTLIFSVTVYFIKSSKNKTGSVSS